MSGSVTFKCVGCGSCCSFSGYVYLTNEDRVRLSISLGLSVADFTDQYCAREDDRYHLKDPEKTCCFLSDSSCIVYESRPIQCRTWPYWPDNFSNGKLRQGVGEYCKGLYPDA